MLKLQQLRGWQPPPWIARNLRVKLLAMLLALASWVVVVYAANPPDSRQLLVHVQQDLQQLPGSYVLAHAIPDITLRINGTREHVDAFRTSSIRATPNFDAIKRTGAQQLVLTVVNTDPNVDLSDVPSSVSAEIGLLGSTTVKVLVRYSKTQVGYKIKSATAEPALVQLTGPQRELGVAQAVVDVNLGTRTATLTQDGVPVIVLDTRSGNRPLADVTVNQGTVQVTVTIVPVNGQVVATVLPQLIGTVAPGHVLTGVSADPYTVTISGPEAVINGFQQIPTPQIGISGLTADHVFSVTLDLSAQGLSFNPATGPLETTRTVNVHVFVGTLPDAIVTPTPPSPAPSSSASPSPRSSPTPCPSATPTPLIGGPTPKPCP